MSSLDALEWRTSSFTDNGANCVEVAMTDDVLVRDSKAPHGGHLVISPVSWTSFLTAIK